MDTLFINAGDPGGQRPDALLRIAQDAREVLLEYHPHADVWICPQVRVCVCVRVCVR